MNLERSLVFVDNKKARGGGQVALEALLAACVARVATTLVMPLEGSAAIRIPEGVRLETDLRSALSDQCGSATTVVANANSALPQVVHAVARLDRQRRRVVSTAAIVHNYPTELAKAVATRVLLKRIDAVYVVEPGLTRLRSDAIIPPWLSIRADDAVLTQPRVELSGRVKSFGRPDKEKGLHFLPELFRRLEPSGWTCEVAIGDSLEGDIRYEEQLRKQLKPWLVDGPRTMSWVEPGDVFVVPSKTEAVCLSAQEALARGAFVVASRVGLMPRLVPPGQSLRTFPVGETRKAAELIEDVRGMTPEAFSKACVEGSGVIAARRGAWYEFMVEALCS